MWTVSDMTQYQERMSPAGVILCIVFIWFCLLVLLFLLVKERAYTGYVQITLQGNGFHYSTMIPVSNAGVAFTVNQTVNYARGLAAVV